ncbi:MAG: CAAX amino terminal protease self- immunity [Methanomethylovorans sp. PtaU1.Bin073]|jgi:membrane protease YdiL (CAAX protease family)|nr:MAG: CAAX amino terminal protease self- immunity [Methanomethylovorans sp. PtaU1.Bin073]
MMGGMDRENVWKLISIVELLIAGTVVVLDLFIPTIIILGIIAISFLIRKEKLQTLGFRKNSSWLKMVATIIVLVIIWTFLHLSIFMPVLNHLTGTTQDLSAFENLKGNFNQLLFFLALTWTLAAFGEEIVYRGYLQKRIRDLFGDTRIGIILAVGISSLLFGLAHTEQGTIGVILTFLDAIFFSLIKMHYDNNLWAAIIAHGASNTIGLVGFFFLGPMYGLW